MLEIQTNDTLPVPSFAARDQQIAVLQADINLRQLLSEKGQPDGYAPLDASGKVPAAFITLPDSLFPQGAWNASTNTPTIPAASAGNRGYYYVTVVAGTYAGNTYGVGDWIVNLDGATWSRIPYSSILAQSATWTVLIGLNGDGATDDFATMQAAASTGLIYWLPGNGKRYRISQRIVFANGGGFVSDGTAVIYGTAANFNNVVLPIDTPSIIGASNACFIYAHGLVASPWTRSPKFTFSGIILESEVSGGRAVDAMVIRNVAEFIVDVEICNFPVSVGIRLDSNGRGTIRCNIHDFYDDSAWVGGHPGLAGIQRDNDLVNSVFSGPVDIINPQIHRLLVGATFLAGHGYETDGITDARPLASQMRVNGGHISFCGEGIDFVGSTAPLVRGTVVEDCYNFGLKAGYGALAGIITGCRVNRNGISNLLLYTASILAGPSKWNVTGNNLDAVNPNSVWTGVASTACVKIDSDVGANKCDKNLIVANSCRPGANGLYAIIDSSTGANRFTLNEEETGSTGTYLNPGFRSTHLKATNGDWTFDIPDDAVVSFTPPSLIGSLVVAMNDGGAMLWIRADGTALQDLGTRNTNINLATGVLAGTTGTDGKMTVSCHTDGKIYIENRRGSARGVGAKWTPTT